MLAIFASRQAVGIDVQEMGGSQNIWRLPKFLYGRRGDRNSENRKPGTVLSVLGSKRGVSQSAGYRFEQGNGLLFCQGKQDYRKRKDKIWMEIISDSDKKIMPHMQRCKRKEGNTKWQVTKRTWNDMKLWKAGKN